MMFQRLFRKHITGSIGLLLLLMLFAGCGSSSMSGMSGQGQSSSNANGTSLGGTPAPDFQLTDQFGKQITLSQFKGMPVIVTFFYTHCPDACPLMAEKIHSALTSLGNNAQHVAIIAVSVDPKGDTPASVKTFSQEHQLDGYTNWHYLLGSRSVLSPVWAKYDVSGVSDNATSMDMTHSSFLYVLDKQGREQTLFDADFSPDQLANNLKQLLA